MPPGRQTWKRKHVTTACISCRESKIKCDGVAPACSNCINKGKHCRYHGDDKRKLSLRLAIGLLANRVNQLNEFISGNGLQPPAMESEENITLSKVLESFSTPQDKPSSLRSGTGEKASLPTFVPQSSAKSENAVIQDISTDAHHNEQTEITLSDNTAPCPINQDWSVIDIQLSNPMLYQLPQQTQSRDLQMYAQSGGWSEQLSTAQLGMESDNEDDNVDPEGITEVIQQLSDRLGTLDIQPGGQVRYFGPTSNFNLIEMPAPDTLTIHRTIRNDGEEHLENLGVGKTVPDELEEHLIKLYMTWQEPSSHVVNKEMYEEARRRWCDCAEDTPYYSESLKNAMCALGAAFENRYHPTFLTFPKSVADFFADRAKALLEIELDQPSVATVQAMVVLSGHDIGCRRDSRGWLYSGMAMRLAFDLALHVDMEPYVLKGEISAAEAELCRTVFWGAYTVDHSWSFYLGRPFRVNMEDITVKKPGENPAHIEGPGWKPYVSPHSEGTLSSISNPTDSLTRQRIILCQIMEPLGHVLYGRSSIPRSALQELNQTTTTQLFNWQANLPLDLQVDLENQSTPYLPHVLLLHMQYFQNIIFAHRPWISKTYIQPEPPQGAGYIHARVMCIDAAISIAKLLSLYEAQYTLRRMNIQVVGMICSAAPILLFATISNRHRNEKTTNTQHLNMCFRALDEFSPSWENAKRVREFLVQLQRRWEAQARVGRVSLKRHDATREQIPSGNCVKRSRTEVPSLSLADGGVPTTGQKSHSQGSVGDAISPELDWMDTANIENMLNDWDGHLYPSSENSIFTGVDDRT